MRMYTGDSWIDPRARAITTQTGVGLEIGRLEAGLLRDSGHQLGEPSSRTSCSSGSEHDVQKLGRRFLVLEPLSNHSEGECLNTSDRFVAVSPVAHDAGQIRHLGQPSAIELAVQLNRESHEKYCSTECEIPLPGAGRQTTYFTDPALAFNALYLLSVASISADSSLKTACC